MLANACAVERGAGAGHAKGGDTLPRIDEHAPEQPGHGYQLAFTADGTTLFALSRTQEPDGLSPDKATSIPGKMAREMRQPGRLRAGPYIALVGAVALLILGALQLRLRASQRASAGDE